MDFPVVNTGIQKVFCVVFEMATSSQIYPLNEFTVGGKKKKV